VSKSILEGFLLILFFSITFLQSNYSIAFILLFFMFFIQVLALIRRIHDIGFSGYWLILYLLCIPILVYLEQFFPQNTLQGIIGFLFLILALIPGEKLDNKYGKNPYPIKKF